MLPHPSLQDARGVEPAVDGPPRRIVSLVPSTTETLGLWCPERVVGVTRFCLRPKPWVDGLPHVGGTKDVDVERVRALQPDLILGNCEENTREIFDLLAPIAPVFAQFPRNVDEALHDLITLGRLLDLEDRARPDVLAIQGRLGALRRASVGRTFRFAILVWRSPWMAVRADTFAAALLAEAGGVSVWESPTHGSDANRYPTFEPAALGALAPDVVFLPSEPFPFAERHVLELSRLTGLAPETFRLVDGQLLTWHGLRLGESLAAVEGWAEALRRA